MTGAELKQLQKQCMLLMQQDDEASGKFPGAQPVSFERRHLAPADPSNRVSLVSSPYFAAEKTDGVRYMLLILGARGTFTVDRNFGMRRMPTMRFPSRTNASASLDGTLLDGELIIERGGTGQLLQPAADSKEQPANGKDGGADAGAGAAAAPDADAAPPPARMRYLAYDACRVAGRPVCDEPLRTRLMHLRREVLGPRFVLSQTQPAAFDAEPFTVELKDFFAVPQLPHIFSRVQPAPPNSDGLLYAFNDPLRKLSHGNDGIIFTPARDPYRPYTCPALLKWKPSNMNSIDFKLMTKWRKEGSATSPQPRFILCVASATSIEPFCWITFSESVARTLDSTTSGPCHHCCNVDPCLLAC